jgi:hypothetical protein
MKATSDGSGKKANWKIIVFVILGLIYGGVETHRTGKDIAHEMSGQKAVPSDASYQEKQVVSIGAQILALRRENDNAEEAFKKTFVGGHLLQPETLSSPTIAAQSLNTIVDHCTGVKSWTEQTQRLLDQERLIDNLPNELSWAYDTYKAANKQCSAITELYQYAADPTRNVQVQNGTVLIVGVEGYNKLVENVNDSIHKLTAANVVFQEAQKKFRQDRVTTAADYGVKQ